MSIIIFNLENKLSKKRDGCLSQAQAHAPGNDRHSFADENGVSVQVAEYRSISRLRNKFRAGGISNPLTANGNFQKTAFLKGCKRTGVFDEIKKTSGL